MAQIPRKANGNGSTIKIDDGPAMPGVSLWDSTDSLSESIVRASDTGAYGESITSIETVSGIINFVCTTPPMKDGSRHKLSLFSPDSSGTGTGKVFEGYAIISGPDYSVDASKLANYSYTFVSDYQNEGDEFKYRDTTSADEFKVTTHVNKKGVSGESAIFDGNQFCTSNFRLAFSNSPISADDCSPYHSSVPGEASVVLTCTIYDWDASKYQTGSCANLRHFVDDCNPDLFWDISNIKFTSINKVGNSFGALQTVNITGSFTPKCGCDDTATIGHIMAPGGEYWYGSAPETEPEQLSAESIFLQEDKDDE